MAPASRHGHATEGRIRSSFTRRYTNAKQSGSASVWYEYSELKNRNCGLAT